MRIVGERKTKVAYVCLLIDRLRHRTHDQRLDERSGFRVTQTLGDGLKITSRDGFGNLGSDSKRVQRRLEAFELLLFWLSVAIASLTCSAMPVPAVPAPYTTILISVSFSLLTCKPAKMAASVTQPVP